MPEKVGVCVTYFPEEIRTFAEFLEAFRNGNMKPAYYKDGAYQILDSYNSSIDINVDEL